MSNFYGATSLVGGGAGALDNIDGAGLSDGDGAVVITDSTAYFYHLDATSGQEESSPDIIAPDSNPGTKRWILDEVYNEHTHANKTELDKVTDGDHDVISSGNPHSVTPTELSLVIGADVEAHSAKLDDLATTGATGAELEELTDGSQTALHSHVDPDKAFTDLTDVDEVSIASADIGKVVKVGDDLKLEFAEDISGGGVDTLVSFTPQCNEPPASNFATLDTRNGHPILDFDDTTNESAIFRGVMPRCYGGGGVTVYLHFAMTSAEADTVDIDVAFERIGDQQLDIDGDSFADVNSVDNTTVPGTTGLVDIVSIPFTNGEDMDSVAAGEGFRLKVTRDAASDDATGDMELLFVEIKETS